MGSPSPDGRFVSFTDWSTGDLALHDFSSGEDRRLTGKDSWATPEFAEFSVVSPDGKQVAYAWFGSDGYELRVISIEDSKNRVLFGQKNTPWVWPVDWTPDGRSVLTWLSRENGVDELALVPLAGGNLRILLSTREVEQASAPSLSPDGRVLLYARPQDGNSKARDIFLRSVRSGDEVGLVRHPADDVPMGWTPDGSHVLFTSDRRGSRDLWAVAVGTAGADGEPELIKSSFGDPPDNFMPMGFTSRGLFLYGTWQVRTDVYVTAFDENGETGPPRKMTELYPGSNRGPAWSPDGSRLAWTSKRQDGYVLVIGELDSDHLTEVQISSRMTSIAGAGIRWSPNPSTILATGRAKDRDGWQGVFTIGVASGETERIASAGPRGVLRHPQWSPDGRSVYFLRRSDEGSAIVVVDLASARESVVLETRVGNMALSPDGRWIVYTTDIYYQEEPNETPAIRVVSTKGGEPETIFESSEVQPFTPRTPLAWSPDSSHVYFGMNVSSPTPRPEDRVELLKIARTGGEASPLGVSMTGFARLRVHPDGRHLAFDTRRNRGEIWSIENLLLALDGRNDY